MSRPRTRSPAPTPGRRPPGGRRPPDRARVASAGRATARRPSVFLLSALVLLGVPLAVAGTPTLLLVAVGLLPTLVALVVDPSRDKFAAITVGSMNAAGLLVPLTDLWLGANDLAQAVSILMRPGYGVLVYGAAAVGWAFHLLIPGLVARALVERRRRRIADLAAEQRKLIDAWGEEVQGRSSRPPTAG